MNTPHTSQGTTHVSEASVEKITGIALEKVPGIHALGGTVERAFSFVLKLVNRSQAMKQGVTASYERGQICLSITLLVAHGFPPNTVAREAGQTVLTEVERLTGVPVARVAIEVLDIAEAAEQQIHSRSTEIPQETEKTVDTRVLITYAPKVFEEVTARAIAPTYGVTANQVKVRVNKRPQGLAISANAPIHQQVLNHSLAPEAGSEALTRAINDHIANTSPKITEQIQRALATPIKSLHFEISEVLSAQGGA